MGQIGTIFLIGLVLLSDLGAYKICAVDVKVSSPVPRTVDRIFVTDAVGDGFRNEDSFSVQGGKALLPEGPTLDGMNLNAVSINDNDVLGESDRDKVPSIEKLSELGRKTLTFRLSLNGQSMAVSYQNLEFTGVQVVVNPSLSIQLIDGPLIENAGVFEPFDVNEDGFINEEDEGLIGVGYDQSQYYVVRTQITNEGNDGELDDIAFLDGLREMFDFAPRLEDADDGAEDGICDDGICDGIADDPAGNCETALSGPKVKKNEDEKLRYIAITPELDLPVTSR